MDVDLVGEGLLELNDVGDVGEQPQLDLRIVGADELCALWRDKSLADAAAFFRAHGNVLEIGIGGGQPAGRGRAHRVGGVDAAGLRVDIGRQRIGVGAAQLGEAAPVQHQLGDGMALGGHVLQHIGVRGPRAGLGFAAAFQLELAEQDVAQLLGRADVEFLAGELVDLGFHLRLRLAEIVGQAAQQIGIDGDAFALHVGQDRDERAFERFIDRALAFNGEARMQQQIKPQRDVGVFAE